MKVFIAVALLVCVLGVEASKHSIMRDSHQCCISSCSKQDRELLERRMAVYELEGNEDAKEVRRYYDLAASGACKTSHGKRANATNGGNMTLPFGPYDVSQSDQSIKVTYTVTNTAGIYYGGFSCSVYVTATYQSYSFSSSDGSYYDNSANSTTITKTVTVILPRYAPYGLYTCVAFTYGPNYLGYVPVSGTFNVTQNINDVAPAKLTSIMVPVWNLNDNDRSFSFCATDDLSGVRSFEVYLYTQSGSYAAYGSYDVPYVNGKYPVQLNLCSALTYLYNYTAYSVGTFNIVVYLYDVMGAYVYYDYTQLKALAIQYNVTIAVGNCNAGRKCPYGVTGYGANAPCTLCDKGTYSGPGAFRCRACGPGTASNVAGAQNCTICPPGTASIGGSAGCDICPAGTFSSSYGNSECQPCYPGTNSTEGSEYCSSCPAGTYSAGQGSATCSACAPGTYSSGGSYYCIPCTPGYYMDKYGASQCTMCPMGTYSWQGFSTCTVCPAPTTNGPTGSNSRLNCY